MKKTVFFLIGVLGLSTLLSAHSYYLVGVDDGNRCGPELGADTAYDRLACVCVEKYDRKVLWQPTSDLTHCDHHSVAGKLTQSQCLGILYMNSPYSVISYEQCRQRGFKVCDDSGDLTHCRNV